jgi:GntR family transcriptional regulator
MPDYKYNMIKNMILEKIESGEYAESAPIESERVLAVSQNCSRMTVRQAISHLVQQGVLYKKQGKGTFVSTNKFSQNSIMSFTKAISSKGKTPNTRVVSFDQKHVSQLSSVAFDLHDTHYFVSKRIRLADITPIAVETVYIPFENCPNLKREMLESSLHQLMEQKYSMTPASCEFSISAMICSEQDMQNLNLPKNSAVLNIISAYYTDKSQLIYIENGVYRGDMYEYQIKSGQIISK